MPDSSPYEVIWGPCELWLAAEGTAEPGLGAVVGGSYSLLGVGGDDNIVNGSVSFANEQSFTEFTPLGSTGAVKAKRATEAVTIAVTLADISVETMAKALNNATITTVAAGAGTVGTKSVPLYQGQDVANFAAVLRFDKSPYGATSGFTPVWRSQFWVPKAYQSATLSLAFNRDGDPAGVQFTFKTLKDATNNFGVWRAVHAGATS